MSLPLYENVWMPISIYNSDDIYSFEKKDAYFMKHLDTCYFTAEIDFITLNDSLSTITINMPELNYDYMPCENTIFATKHINNDEINTIVRIKLFPQKIVLYAYPFEINTYYEFNIQLFMRMKNSSFINNLLTD